MDKYINHLKEMATNFSYYEFIEILKEIDNEIVNGNIESIGPEFIYYFNQIMGLVNEQYIVDGKPGTLGHMLIENALINKQRISPTLMMYFYIEQKDKLGLNNTYNNIKFTDRNEVSTMGVTIGNPLTLKLNLDYLKKTDDVDSYNYEIMEGLLHEITHVYQYNVSKDTDNLFAKLTYYDIESYLAIFKHLSETERNIIYSSVLSEFMANEQSKSYMLNIAENHPEYFNQQLIEKKKIQYIKERRSSPRQQFTESLGFLRFLYRDKTELIQPFFDKLEQISVESRKIEEELRTQGISEDINYNYFNIFMNTLYKFDGEKLNFDNQRQLAQNMEVYKPKTRVKTINTNVTNNNGFTSIISLIAVSIILLLGIILACLLL